MNRAILTFLFLPFTLYAAPKKPLIMINPAGHAREVGRRLQGSFERVETYKFAQKLKSKLEQQGIRVVLTREPGEHVVQLQNASFANRLKPDLYLDLSMCEQEQAKPTINLFYLQFDPFVDRTQKTEGALSFVPLRKAHYKNLKLSEKAAQFFFDRIFSKKFSKTFDCCKPVGIPYKPLVGMSVPAVALEISFSNQRSLSSLVNPIVEWLMKIAKKAG